MVINKNNLIKEIDMLQLLLGGVISTTPFWKEEGLHLAMVILTVLAIDFKSSNKIEN